MASILDLYAGAQKELGLDKLVPNSPSKGTPYSDDKTFAADTKVLSDEKLKSGRGGTLNNTKYSDSVKR